MLRSNLCDFSEAYILLKGTITVVRRWADVATTAADRNDKQVIFKNCAPLTNCISKINNALVENTKDLDILISYIMQ